MGKRIGVSEKKEVLERPRSYVRRQSGGTERCKQSWLELGSEAQVIVVWRATKWLSEELMLVGLPFGLPQCTLIVYL